MKQLIAFVAMLIIATQIYAQSREDERRPTRLPVTVIVDKEANGNWMKVVEIGGGMSNDLMTEMFIADDSGIDPTELDRLNLAEQYQVLFGASEVVPHELIVVVAEQQAKELEMADWEFVGAGNVQYDETCDSDGKPNWPKTLYPCLEPVPLPKLPEPPVGKDPIPPEPEPAPSADGKQLPPTCGHEIEYLWGITILTASADYECFNYQGSIFFKDWAATFRFGKYIKQGTLAVTFGYWKAGGWVYPAKNNKYSADQDHGEQIVNASFAGGLVARKVKFFADPSPQVFYNWDSSASKIVPFTLFNPNPWYPLIQCITDDSYQGYDDEGLWGCPDWD